MYFADLTPYTYCRNPPRENILNVGWLSEEHAFPAGDTTAEFRRALSELATEPVNLCRGFHDCEFCAPAFFCRWQPAHSESVASGNGEIRVPALQGDIVYVAPVLVTHYVEAHNYLPPPAFVEAVEVFAHTRRMAWEALRVQWKARFPALDGRWMHWRLFAYERLVSVVSRDELGLAIENVEKLYRSGLSVCVSRSYRAFGGEGVVVEPVRHEISDVDGGWPRGFPNIVLPLIESMQLGGALPTAFAAD